jgi:hypothetical protein
LDNKGGENCGTLNPSDLNAAKAITLASSALSSTILRAPFLIFFAIPNCTRLCAEPSASIFSTCVNHNKSKYLIHASINACYTTETTRVHKVSIRRHVVGTSLQILEKFHYKYDIKYEILRFRSEIHRCMFRKQK